MRSQTRRVILSTRGSGSRSNTGGTDGQDSGIGHEMALDEDKFKGGRGTCVICTFIRRLLGARNCGCPHLDVVRVGKGRDAVVLPAEMVGGISHGLLPPCHVAAEGM